MSETTPPGDPESIDAREALNPEEFFDTLFLYQELRDDADSHPTEVGPYRIVHLLEEGGMGAVYLAERTEPMRMKVALKLMKKGMTSLEEISRFEVERQALAVMNHPNVAGVKDAGATKDGKPFFVMEYVEGGVPFTEYCDQKKLKIHERLELFLQVCDGLEHAHQRAVIHRDLKPQNILVAEHEGKPVPKVIDFGLAKIQDRESFPQPLTSGQDMVAGTPEYMAPEQTAGDEADTRTDTYALGVILYELIVGVLPFAPEVLRSGSSREILTRIREGERPLPSRRLTELDYEAQKRILDRRHLGLQDLRKALRVDLNWVISKAIRLDPEARYQSVAELTKDVQCYMDGYPVSARPATLAYRGRKFLERNRWQLSVAAGFVLLLLGTLIFFQVAAIVESSGLLTKGQEMWERFSKTNEEKSHAYRDWQATRDGNLPWFPAWERGKEIRAWQEFSTNVTEIENLFSGAVQSFRQAYERAPFYSGVHPAARRALERAYITRYREAREEGNVRIPPKFFEDMVRAVGLETYEEELSGVQEIRIETDPGDARIYCFRYVNVNEYLLPLAYSLQDGVVGDPFLRVWKVKPGHEPFRRGDRFLEVIIANDGKEQSHGVRTRGELAEVLSTIQVDERVEVKLLRTENGKPVERTESWRPYRSGQAQEYANLTPGTLREPYKQFGFLLGGYPLDFVPACQIPKRDGSRTAVFSLPPGSYLLVARRSGYEDTRLPLSIPTSLEHEFKIELLRREGVPEGYVHVPAGSFTYGGDSESYEGLNRGTLHVDGFFISRLEVTCGEYLEFLNAPETLKRLNEDLRGWVEEGTVEEGKAADWLGWVEPLADWKAVLERRLLPPERRVNLLPFRPSFSLDRNGGRVTAVSLTWAEPEWPVLGVRLYAALEYAHWLSQRDEKWRYRLPTDFEWEKAARGRDQRKFVWGNYLFWSFSNTTSGDATKEEQIGPVGLYPMDESVYGILDMTGSVSEPVITLTENQRLPRTHLRFCTYRGANWDATDARDVHLASRQRILPAPRDAVRYVGIRLVAEAKEATKPTDR